jgi:hypothetical protein
MGQFEGTTEDTEYTEPRARFLGGLGDLGGSPRNDT